MLASTREKKRNGLSKTMQYYLGATKKGQGKVATPTLPTAKKGFSMLKNVTF
jgi:hypothetical protein